MTEIEKLPLIQILSINGNKIPRPQIIKSSLCEPFKAVQHEQNKDLPFSRHNFREFLESL